MKISAKGRYGLAAMVFLAKACQSDNPTTILTISENLGISKIYLEQVFSLLKHAHLVTSSKGSQGGYQLAKQPQEISSWDVLSAIELPLTEKTAASVEEKRPELERALQSAVYEPLDESVRTALQKTTLRDLLEETDRQKSEENLMYFI